MSPWLIWQLADSAFPSGGFAHSGGMEAAWQHGVVRDAESVTEFIRAALRQLNRGVLGFVRESWKSPENFDEIDARCDLFVNNHVSNRASRAQGRAFLAAAAGVFENEAIVALSSSIRQQQSAGHLAPVFGLICRHIGVDEPTSGSLFGFVFLRCQISVAVRLGIIGPIQGQQIQAELSGLRSPSPGFPGEGERNPHPNPLPDYRERRLDVTAEPVQISPVLDLVQATQDRLYSRLFQS